MLLGHVGHPIENISLSNVTFRGPGGGEAKQARRAVPERARNYPQMAWYGEMPSYGLYARHIRGLRLSNMQLETAAPDARHALVLDDVENANLSGLGFSPATGTALMRLSQTKNVLVRGSQPLCSKGTFLEVTGPRTSDIALVGNDFTRVGQICHLVAGGLNDGVPAYTDRAYTWANVPAHLVGADYVQTANDDAGEANLSIDVTVGELANLYVFLDDRRPLPAWITPVKSRWRDTGNNISLQPDNLSFSVYAKSIPAGASDDALGASDGDGAHYGIAITAPTSPAIVGIDVTGGRGGTYAMIPGGIPENPVRKAGNLIAKERPRSSRHH
jgi:hypothetical protein